MERKAITGIPGPLCGADTCSLVPSHLTPDPTMRSLLISFLAAASMMATPAAAQSFDSRRPAVPSRTFGGAQLFVGQPLQQFDQNVDASFGVGGHVIHQLGRSGVLSLRADAGYLIYGSETKHIPLPPPIGERIVVDLNTTNSFAFFGAGPQVMAPTGRLRPYINGSIGLKYLATNSSLEGQDGNDQSFNTTNFDDVALAWSGGGGLYIPVKRGLRPISIDLGAKYHGGSEIDYLAEGRITDNPDGSITPNPVRGRTDMVVYHLGVSFGF